MVKLIHDIGSQTIRASINFYSLICFFSTCFSELLSPSSYSNATKGVLIRQIYFTTVQILPLFFSLSLIVGTVLIGTAMGVLGEMGLSEYFGNVVVGIVITEIIPIIIVFWIALRSSSAMNAEIALMKVNGEIETLRAFHINPLRYLVLPRVLNGMISLPLLTFLSAIIAVASGLVVSTAVMGFGIDTYTNMVVQAIDLYQIGVMFCKSVAFGFFITAIPIYFGLRASDAMTDVPIAVLQGMVVVFNSIILIEGFSLAAKFV